MAKYQLGLRRCKTFRNDDGAWKVGDDILYTPAAMCTVIPALCLLHLYGTLGKHFAANSLCYISKEMETGLLINLLAVEQQQYQWP